MSGSAVAHRPARPAARPPAAVRRRGRGGGSSMQRASAFTYIVVIVAVALFGVPFVWIVLTALASQTQLAQGTSGLLHVDPQWSNFWQAATRINFAAYAGNSLFLSTIVSTLTTATSSLVGFAFARLRARGQNALFTVVVATMMIPSIAILIPTYVMFSRVGLVGTYWPWVLWGLSGTPYLIFLFRQFYTSIPMELEDAAIIDGCGWWRIYAQVFLPLARPVLLTSLILSFTWTWGDYLAPSLLLSSNNTTLAVATAVGYLDPHGNGLLTLQAAGAVMYVLPVIVIFLIAQRQFMGSAIGSGVKG